MHLADGIVTSPGVLAGAGVAAATALGVAMRRARLEEPRALAWTGMIAAFVLSAQAVNVPLLPGTSAHVIGASLAAMTLGPARAIVALAAVLVVQAIALGDGGITTLGLNLLDMAVLPVACVTLCRGALGGSRGGLAAAAVVGTLAGSVTGAVLLAAALVAGAGAPPHLAFPWLVGAQGLAGVAEGVLTAVAIRHLEHRAPGLVAPEKAAREEGPPRLRMSFAWAALAIGITAALVPLASSAPDALERLLPRVAQRP